MKMKFYSVDFQGPWHIVANFIYWLDFVNLIQIRVSWEERTSTEEFPSSDWPVGMSVVHFLNF